ncbi:L,D-transpeptidase [Methylocystis sp.]|uniref:L,D-transpeptidase n=1 Tax=Methylocystis sp. TaxID=1911079 RepID=UPI003DA454E6
MGFVRGLSSFQLFGGNLFLSPSAQPLTTASPLGYRIHGATEPETIGVNVSSECDRMISQDIAHLYTRASIGTGVIVLA